MRFVLIAAAVASLTACKTKHCVEHKSETPGTTFREEWNGCPDDHIHSVECEMRGSEYTCNCFPGHTFVQALPAGTQPGALTPQQAREGCEWDFTP